VKRFAIQKSIKKRYNYFKTANAGNKQVKSSSYGGETIQKATKFHSILLCEPEWKGGEEREV